MIGAFHVRYDKDIDCGFVKSELLTPGHEHDLNAKGDSSLAKTFEINLMKSEDVVDLITNRWGCFFQIHFSICGGALLQNIRPSHRKNASADIH